jgi:hypothetical protein
MVSDSSRFVIGFGVNDYGDTAQDPLLVRWSDQENYQVWTPAITNQAGSYRLSSGSTIVAAQQTRQEILVFTDSAVFSMQYLGTAVRLGLQHPVGQHLDCWSERCGYGQQHYVLDGHRQVLRLHRPCGNIAMLAASVCLRRHQP